MKRKASNFSLGVPLSLCNFICIPMKVIKWIIELWKKIMRNYILYNTGSSTSIGFAINVSDPWIAVTPQSGSIAVNSQTNVKVFIGPEANTLLAGTYRGTITLINTTNGRGNTTREVTLIINETSFMLVYPSSGSVFTGSVGGPFTDVF